MASSSDLVVGIDLGTTNSCVGCYKDDNLNILINQEGTRTTPSFVYVLEAEGLIVGKYALKMSNMKPEYGIGEIKRLIGRKFDDPNVQSLLEYFPFSVTSNSNNEPVISIKRKNSDFKTTAEEICTDILKKIKKDISDKLRAVNKAVITVPAYFNVNQRSATLKAAEKAGFTVVKLLNEPTAAAFSYYFQHKEAGKCCLVYDLGGGTFDVAILRKSIDNIDVIGVSGDSQLGGHDFDNIILDFACDILEKNYNYSPKEDRRAMCRLRTQCMEAKEILSIASESSIDLVNFVPRDDGEPVQIKLTRKKFEDLCSVLFKRTITIMEDCIKSCNLTKNDIDEVILSGGSTRIPKIQRMVSAFFNGKELNKFLNPDECVAEGAALQAAMLSQHPKQKIDLMKIIDVIPLSLGTSMVADRMDILIKRNTPIPVTRTKSHVTVYNNQKSMTSIIYEGERTNATKNRHLATITITDITPAPPGQCEVFYTFSIDMNGILKVTAKEKCKENSKELIVSYSRGHRSDKEVKNALIDAEENKFEDQRFTKFAKLKEFVIKYCESACYNFDIKNLTNDFLQLYELCKSIQKEAKNCSLNDEKKLKQLKEEMLTNLKNVVKKHNFEIMPILDTD